MEYELYKDYVSQTVTNSYPKYIREIIVKILKDKGIIVDELEQKDEDLTIEASLSKSLEEHQEAIKFIEEWEFIRPYKHAVLFIYSGFNQGALERLKTVGEIIPFVADPEVFDVLLAIDPDSVAAPRFQTPTFFEDDSKLYFKFNLKYKGYLPGTNTQTKLKYPILIVIHKDMPVLEVRFDRINTYYKDGETFYRDKIKLATTWAEVNLALNLENFNLQPILDYVDRSELPDLTVSAKRMDLKKGGKVTLESNKDYVLPLLGELKELMKEHEDEFIKSPVINQLLIDFITNTEETSDLPWMSLCWKNKVKTKDVIVKFQHNYYKEEYTLLQYTGVLKELERMDNVTKHLIELKDKLDKQPDAI
ncbi:hypothetical protein REC12_11625 [Desulfosporosinus sp. PR]|uniref:hypothetical protein n=1 Tax=Candidatus Desulfosporosinus nitrosoreducens TaxID=3401928 RepID=UPI0027FFFAF9|nr:hypothetical protein [Desulfosporosinus sp. PR]MDQ7094239.1 hypothetical protein [Desulfosporosinus sp. PR]